MRMFKPGDKVLVPWYTDPSGFIDAVIVEDSGTDMWGMPMYVVRPVGELFGTIMLENNIVKVQTRPVLSGVACDCGVTKTMGEVSLDFHSDWCTLNKG